MTKRVSSAGWGKGAVEQLADYLSKSAPGLAGFSDKNIWRMKQFYETYRDDDILSPLVSEISWTNNLIIMARCKAPEEQGPNHE